MRRFRLLSLLIAIVLLIGLGGTASAQTYLFEVERAEAAIYIESDGSATVEYTYTFVNDPSADPMEYAVSYTHLRAHETVLDLVCRLLLEKKK